MVELQITVEQLRETREKLKAIAEEKTGYNNPWKKIARKVFCTPNNVKIFFDQGVKYPKLQHRRMLEEADAIIKLYEKRKRLENVELD